MKPVGADVGLNHAEDWDRAFSAWSMRAPLTAAAGQDCGVGPETGEA